MPWYSAARAWDAQEVQQPAFNLAAGWIGEEDPALSAVIPMAFGIEVLDMARAPAVAMNEAGLFVYVSDDGTSSELHQASVDGGDDVVAELPEVVWSLALTPAGDSAYLNLLERKTGSDMGVWRVVLPNGPGARRVMPPVVEPLGGLVPAARIPYQAYLVVKTDPSWPATAAEVPGLRSGA